MRISLHLPPPTASSPLSRRRLPGRDEFPIGCGSWCPRCCECIFPGCDCRLVWTKYFVGLTIVSRKHLVVTNAEAADELQNVIDFRLWSSLIFHVLHQRYNFVGKSLEGSERKGTLWLIMKQLMCNFKIIERSIQFFLGQKFNEQNNLQFSGCKQKGFLQPIIWKKFGLYYTRRNRATMLDCKIKVACPDVCFLLFHLQ